jgi:selenocysteine lyase/cysteine desulfurase
VGQQEFPDSVVAVHAVGAQQPLSDSLYLTSKPAFMGSNPWPWVDPTTGTTYTVPAKARFDAGTPNTVP